MNNKKKQTAVVAMATVLSVTTIASPLPVMAQENPVSPAIVQENGQQETAPTISVPENLKATAGMTLKDVELPKQWTWADDSTVITAEITAYPARFTVEDGTYDYTKVEGYNPDNHYVERMVTITVEPEEQEPAQPSQKQTPRLGGNTPTTYATGDIEINATNFPDEAFRTWLESQSYGSDKKITQAEIAGIQTINVNGKSDIKNLTGIGNFTALAYLYCNGTGITSLDVSKNTALLTLRCDSTEITSLNVSQNKALASLYCYSTKITSLDVSQNKALTTLDCNGTDITGLDVSANTALTWLNCRNTKITGLDVSANTALTTLNCNLTPLAYLNIGASSTLTNVSASYFQPVSLEVTGDTFNVETAFPGIDKSKISITSGAKYDSETGVMSNYQIGTPIKYTYACGTSANNTEQKINVTIDLTDSRADSTITITENLSKIYDGKAVNDKPNVNTTGSTGTVSYKWEKKISDTDNWQTIDSAPTDAGTYRVTATIASDTNYKSASATKEFTIAQAVPSYTAPVDLEATYGQTLADVTLPTGFSWTDATQSVGNAGTNTFTVTFTPDDTKNYQTVENISITLTVQKADNAQTGDLSMDGWTYGDTPANASASFRFGTPRFLYADRADGTYTDTLPTDAGTWYVKAVVDGTDNYEGAESQPVSFVIAPKDTTSDSKINVPEITADTNLENLVVKDGDTVLVPGRDYDVTKTQEGKKVTVTLTFKGNYTGTITKTYTVEEKTPAGGDKDKNNKADGTKNDNKNDKQNTNKNGAVQTGDTSPVGLWATLMALSAGVAVFLKRKKRKEETK